MNEPGGPGQLLLAGPALIAVAKQPGETLVCLLEPLGQLAPDRPALVTQHTIMSLSG